MQAEHGGNFQRLLQYTEGPIPFPFRNINPTLLQIFGFIALIKLKLAGYDFLPWMSPDEP